MDAHMETGLVVAALRMALQAHQPPKELLHGVAPTIRTGAANMPVMITKNY